MKSLAIIPARSGSKGLKDKNILPLDGKPLLAYSVETAFSSGCFDVVHVSTDSERYADIARQFDADVPFLRSAETAADNASSWDVVREVLENYEKAGKYFDTVVLLQPTSPLRTPEDIRRVYQLMEERRAEAVVSVCEMEHSPLWCNTLPEDGCMDGFLLRENEGPRQALRPYYRINGAIYLMRVSAFRRWGKLIYGPECYAYIMTRNRSIDIDTSFDFWLGEQLLQQSKCGGNENPCADLCLCEKADGSTVVSPSQIADSGDSALSKDGFKNNAFAVRRDHKPFFCGGFCEEHSPGKKGADILKAVMVVGLGSMGSRRLCLLRSLRPELRLCGVDMDKGRCQRAEENFHISTYPSVSEAIRAEEPEAAVVSTSPLSHSAIIHECLKAGLHVFTELNLVPDGYRENMALAAEHGRVLFLSSTFLYREETRYLIDRCRNCNSVLNYRYHVGQYLPDWHPWEHYRDYFVGDARTNGCRELFAIELPWLCAAFGPISDIQCIHGKSSGLQIPYDDSYMLLLRHEDGHMGSLCVDVVSRKDSRQFEVYGENLSLTWRGDPDSLYDWDVEKKADYRVRPYKGAVHHQQGYAGFIIENAYAEELSAFLAQIEQGTVPPYGFADDLTTLRWIDRIEGRDSP